MVTHNPAAPSDIPQTSEVELIRLTVDFANGQLRGALLRTQGLGIPEPLRIARIQSLDVSRESMQPSADNPENSVGPIRGQLQGDLQAIVSGKLSPHAIKRLKRHAYGVEQRPVDYERKTRSVVWHYKPKNLEAIISHLTMLLYLAHGTERDGGDLNRCKLPSCGLFFFSSDGKQETGRPREAYCSNEHMLEQHRSTSTLRVQKYRERKRLEAAAAENGQRR
jgi:hypothetical protein